MWEFIQHREYNDRMALKRDEDWECRKSWHNVYTWSDVRESGVFSAKLIKLVVFAGYVWLSSPMVAFGLFLYLDAV